MLFFFRVDLFEELNRFVGFGGPTDVVFGLFVVDKGEDGLVGRFAFIFVSQCDFFCFNGGDFGCSKFLLHQ